MKNLKARIEEKIKYVTMVISEYEKELNKPTNKTRNLTSVLTKKAHFEGMKAGYKNILESIELNINN